MTVFSSAKFDSFMAILTLLYLGILVASSELEDQLKRGDAAVSKTLNQSMTFLILDMSVVAILLFYFIYAVGKLIVNRSL